MDSAHVYHHDYFYYGYLICDDGDRHVYAGRHGDDGVYANALRMAILAEKIFFSKNSPPQKFFLIYTIQFT